MAKFKGTSADETITPNFVSPTVTATGGARPSDAPDVIDGGAGNDIINGGGGADLLFGGSGDDVVTGGAGNDTAFLGRGNDRFIWNPGDGSDTVDGQAGFDTLQFNGADNENVTISANGEHATFFRDVGNVTMDLDGIERIEFAALGGADVVVNDLSGTDVKQVAIDLAVAHAGDGQPDSVTVNGTAHNDRISIASSGASVVVKGLSADVTIDGAEAANDSLVINGLAGNDTIDASALNAGQIKLVIDSGAGDDHIVGSAGNDNLSGGDGNDVIVGGHGSDTALLGAGNDVFIWNPGDGSDTVDGQAGFDTLVFNGAAANENFTVSANGTHATLFRDVGNVSMDLVGVERIEIAALGGADNIVVNDLSGTDVKQVAIDLAAGGDNQSDHVTVNATAGDDVITIARAGDAVAISGLAATVTIAHADSALDRLTVSGGAGNDTIDASNLPDGQIGLTLDGGAGNDVIHGSHGDDLVIGGTGADTVFLGAGNDRFVWNPGDGSDVVDGQSGFDTLAFNGAAGNENITISANGEHATFFRDVGNVTMDLDSIERIEFAAVGGSDNVVVNDLSGTDVKQVAIDLAAVGTGVHQLDTVTINGSGHDDRINVTASGTVVTVSGLSAQVTIDHGNGSDHLSINGGAGNDTINASAVPVGTMALTLDGGTGDDLLIGGNGNDKFVLTSGQSGHDTILGFQAHGAGTQGDVVALAGFSDHSFDQAVADGHIAQVGANVVISDGAHTTATLEHVSLASLHANDFLFA